MEEKNNSKSYEGDRNSRRHLLIRDTQGRPQCCLQRQRCCPGRDRFKVFPVVPEDRHKANVYSGWGEII